MPTVTLNIDEPDLALIADAKEKLGDHGMSCVFIESIRRKLEWQPKGALAKITIETREETGGPTIHKTFHGQWLIHPDENLQAKPNESEAPMWRDLTFALARTKKGSLIVYKSDHDHDEGFADIIIYEDFIDLQGPEEEPNYHTNVIAAFADALGETYEVYLDI